MEKYNSFEFLKKLSFERIGGSNKEKEAANMIKAEIEKLGLEAKIETFEVDFPLIKEAKLVTSNSKEYKVTGYGMTGNTLTNGLTKQFKYILFQLPHLFILNTLILIQFNIIFHLF